MQTSGPPPMHTGSWSLRKRYDNYMSPVSGAATIVSVEEYLRTSYKPACDYVDGALKPKPRPTRKHSAVQGRLAALINAAFPAFEAGPELTVKIKATRFLVPDVAVQEKSRLQDPYPVDPVHLCVEILSPEDRMSEIVAKCEEYLAWGVPTAWIVDPEERRAWQMDCGAAARLHEVETLHAGPIAIPCSAIFSVL